MTLYAALYAGLLAGLSVAAPIGPMSLLCIHRTLSFGTRVGISTGLGAATVNVCYAAAIALGLDEVSPWMASDRHVLSAIGGVFLLWLAALTLLRGRPADSQPERVAPSAVSAFGSAVIFNATNPLSPLLIMALLSPMLALSTPSAGGIVAMLLGMFIAAAAWWVCLSFAVSSLRMRLSAVLLTRLNWGAGALLSLYGALALARSVGS